MNASPSASPDSKRESSRRLVGLLIHTAIDALILGLALVVVNKQSDRLNEMERRLQHVESKLNQGTAP